jgi:GTP-binding protein HflX
MSATREEDVAALHGRIRDFFEATMEEADFMIPYDQQARVAMLHERCRVLEERYEEEGAHLRVRAPEAVLGAIRRAFESGR